MLHPGRVHPLNDASPRAGRYVLYWMQQAQRCRYNHALDHAVDVANELGLPVIVGFGLMDDYPEANERHYAFMLEGLAETAAGLAERGIRLVVRHGAPDRVALDLAADAAAVVCDMGYLRHQRAWRRSVAERAGCRVVGVETDVVVPLATASDRLELAARTLRPKLQRQLDTFLVAPNWRQVARGSLELEIDADTDVREPRALLRRLSLDRSIGPVRRFRGGASEAGRWLQRFLRDGLPGYAEARGDPAEPRCSYLSPYLHFGQISPLEIALAVRDAEGASADDRASFLEELIVRRELSHNFVAYCDAYDRYEGLPEWARRTLAEHAPDVRPRVYDESDLASGHTHDAYWNASMREMRLTGYMHNHMRMYWGKKILEWSRSPAQAFATALRLNNRYFLDGRDASSFTGVAWCFGRHDRPWSERPIFGKVRYMNAAGLRRKFEIGKYVRWADGLAG
jgi:deoxyribodipyrimidine photo-lyase